MTNPASRSLPVSGPWYRSPWSCGSLLVAALLALAFPFDAAAVTGTVVNATSETPVSNVEVGLVIHAPDTTQTLKATSGANGGFAFQVSGIGPESQTFLTAHYDHVDYVQQVDPASEEPVRLPVYERTESDADVSISSHHVIIDRNAGEIIHVLIANNAGNRTYQTGEGHGHGLEVPLPEGITEILGGPEGIHAHGSTLIDPRPVRPGASQLMYSLRLTDSGEFEQRVSYPTDNVDVLVLPAETEVRSSTLEDLGPVTFNGRSFRRLTASGLVPGDRFSLAFGGAGSEWILWSRSGPFIWVIGGGAIAIVLLIYWLRPKQLLAPAASGGSDLRARQDALVAAIADLDDRLDAGDLSEADHKTRRDALKDELLRVARQLEE